MTSAVRGRSIVNGCGLLSIIHKFNINTLSQYPAIETHMVKYNIIYNNTTMGLNRQIPKIHLFNYFN